MAFEGWLKRDAFASHSTFGKLWRLLRIYFVIYYVGRVSMSAHTWVPTEARRHWTPWS